MLLALAHICIRTKDLAATERFYVEGLGCQRLFRFLRNDNVTGVYLRVAGQTFIEIFQGEDPGQPAGPVAHLCFQVSDIEAARERLAKCGVQTSDKKMGADQSYQTWFSDPNGIPIELHEYTACSAQYNGQDVLMNW